MSHLKKTEYSIPAAGVSIRVALLSDLHRGSPREAIDLLREDTPDLVLIAGDLYESPPRNPFQITGALELLHSVTGLAPIIYCRGNHDATPHPELDSALREAGGIELSDSEITLPGMRIGGLCSAHYTGGVPDIAFLDRFSREDGFKLLLCHHPEYYPRWIRPRAINLTVSGHAHGGQWAIAGHGLLAPGQGIFPRYTHGVYDGRLVVSRGLCNSIRIPRIGVPTEVVYITIGR